MKTKRSYAAVDVEKFDAEAVLPLLTTGCLVAIDVAKTKFVAAIATHDAKAAVVLAKLQAIKPARAWAPDSDERRDLRAWSINAV